MAVNRSPHNVLSIGAIIFMIIGDVAVLAGCIAYLITVLIIHSVDLGIGTFFCVLIFLFLVAYFIVSIYMTYKIFKYRQYPDFGAPSMMFKVSILLIFNLIAGICLLCDNMGY